MYINQVVDHAYQVIGAAKDERQIERDIKAQSIQDAFKELDRETYLFTCDLLDYSGEYETWQQAFRKIFVTEQRCLEKYKPIRQARMMVSNRMRSHFTRQSVDFEVFNSLYFIKSYEAMERLLDNCFAE